MHMTCESLDKLLTQFLDRESSERERRAVNTHLTQCAHCRQRCEDLRYVRTTLRRLPRIAAPKTLSSQLRVIASYDRERRQGAGEFSSPWQRWLTRARVTMRDLMRPLALPAAGGLLSSILFFTMLVDTFALQLPAQDDIPIGTFRQVTVGSLSPFGFTGADMTVELTIDKTGRVVGLVPTGTISREQLNQLGNLILFTSFNPATSDGQPTSGKVVLKSFKINVRG
jgi:predicted anti-sigma-YlaC factor YlaD